ncbi:hypothetical protein [Sphingomonas sp. SUN039]|uniref:hypothetical protein n=1 Tax=Sphingomonas sp. SUN039 TaxID=2937787 RepID=UPI00216442F5|nr:hypothetical protein [Sphingomonas sp. SUN039]UVO53984.1 hypothetical protein M0209_07560 [Sphingomonas sp. SUN039]
MNFTYDRVWADLVAMVRANAALLATLAGAFLFLPSFALWLFAPMPEPPTGGGGDGGEGLRFIMDYYRGNWPGLLLVSVVSTFGQAAIVSLLLDRNRPTVGEALAKAGRLFPMYFLLGIMTSLAMGFGFFLLFVPGIYLLGRLTVAGPVMIGENVANPIEAIRRGWIYTKGLGWRIAGLILLIGITGWIGFSAISSVLGVVAGLVLPTEASALVKAFADALGGAALALLVAVLTAAIYRQLRGGDSALPDIFS